MGFIRRAAVCVGLSAMSLFGQTTATNIAAFSVESVLKWTDVDADATPSLDAGLLASIQSGALEIRQTDVYDPSSSSMQVTAFVVQAGSPLPTPAGAVGLATIWSYKVNVDRTEVLSKPRTALAFYGAVSALQSVSPFGDITGSPIVITTSYSNDNSGATKFGVVTTDLVGSAVMIAKSGAGSIKISFQTGPPVAFAGPKGIQVTSPSFQLDARQSADPSGGLLTYQWTFMPVQGQTVNMTGANTATPSVTLPDGAFYGDYRFQLTVTNAAGQSSTDQVVITFVAPDPPPADNGQ